MIYFVVYLFLEVIISVNISSSIGGFATFFEILLSAGFGIMILIGFKDSMAEKFTAVSFNVIDLEEFQRLNLFTLFGAILLIIPGFMTDIMGLLMQFSVFTTMLVNRYAIYKKKGDIPPQNPYNEVNYSKDSDVIDVEVIHTSTTVK